MRLNEINLADSPKDWQAAGFTVVDGYVRIGRSFRFKLSDCEGSGVLDFTFGDANRSDSSSFEINGLRVHMQGNPAYLDEPVVPHSNLVVGAFKLVIQAVDTDDTAAQFLANIPELGKPIYSGTAPDGNRVYYWNSPKATDFEIYSTKEAIPADKVAAVLLYVEDLDGAIAAVGENNVSAKSVYFERDMVVVSAQTGITPKLIFISKNPNKASGDSEAVPA